MRDAVEIYSATDPVYFQQRKVSYWLEFRGVKSERVTEWATVNAWATALLAEHDAVLIDRSDKGAYLHLTL